MLTGLADVDYKPGATHRDWTAALEAIPKELQEWFQLRCGQAITGYKPDDDAVIVEQGSGANGKNTIMEAFLATLGDYFKVASPRALLGNPDQHPTELADLYGARMVWLDELPEGRYLPALRIKQLTSGQLSARKIGKDNMTLEVLFSLFVSTNYLPIVNETDEGTWRRLFLLHFPYQFRKSGQPLKLDTDKAGDANLRQRLRRGHGQRQAILSWLVEGARAWYDNGRQFPKPDPEIIDRDRAEWRKRDDSVWRFIDEQLEFDPEAHVMSTDLFQQFTLWQSTQNQKQWGEKTFSDRLSNHEITADRGIYRKRLRKRPDSGLSRPTGIVSLAMIPEQYNAWLGLRFRLPAMTVEY
jgi:putative DNA primase/helicase